MEETQRKQLEETQRKQLEEQKQQQTSEELKIDDNEIPALEPALEYEDYFNKNREKYQHTNNLEYLTQQEQQTHKEQQMIEQFKDQFNNNNDFKNKFLNQYHGQGGLPDFFQEPTQFVVNGTLVNNPQWISPFDKLNEQLKEPRFKQQFFDKLDKPSIIQFMKQYPQPYLQPHSKIISNTTTPLLTLKIQEGGTKYNDIIEFKNELINAIKITTITNKLKNAINNVVNIFNVEKIINIVNTLSINANIEKFANELITFGNQKKEIGKNMTEKIEYLQTQLDSIELKNKMISCLMYSKNYNNNNNENMRSNDIHYEFTSFIIKLALYNKLNNQQLKYKLPQVDSNSRVFFNINNKILHTKITDDDSKLTTTNILNNLYEKIISSKPNEQLFIENDVLSLDYETYPKSFNLNYKEFITNIINLSCSNTYENTNKTRLTQKKPLFYPYYKRDANKNLIKVSMKDKKEIEEKIEIYDQNNCVGTHINISDNDKCIHFVASCLLSCDPNKLNICSEMLKKTEIFDVEPLSKINNMNPFIALKILKTFGFVVNLNNKQYYEVEKIDEWLNKIKTKDEKLYNIINNNEKLKKYLDMVVFFINKNPTILNKNIKPRGIDEQTVMMRNIVLSQLELTYSIKPIPLIYSTKPKEEIFSLKPQTKYFQIGRGYNDMSEINALENLYEDIIKDIESVNIKISDEDKNKIILLFETNRDIEHRLKKLYQMLENLKNVAQIIGTKNNPSITVSIEEIEKVNSTNDLKEYVNNLISQLNTSIENNNQAKETSFNNIVQNMKFMNQLFYKH